MRTIDHSALHQRGARTLVGQGQGELDHDDRNRH